MENTIQFICVGKIVNTHGLKGEIKLLSQTDFKEDRYSSNNKAYIDFNNDRIHVKIIKYRTHQGFDLLTFENLDNINLVEKFKGHDLYVENNNPTKLKPYEYHQKDIIGLSVFQNNINIGIVEEIRTYPQCDYLVIAKIDGKKSLIPFRKEFILSVNQADRQILIVEMEGLL